MDLKTAARTALRLLDLTSLGDDDTDDDIVALARRGHTEAGDVAALCVYARFIPIALATLREIGADDVRIATVSVFPHGHLDANLAAVETRACVANGADEVDTVLPYRDFLAGDIAGCRNQLLSVREACHDKTLKVILETGQLVDVHKIAEASRLAIECGADFIKTSTGKVDVNATPEAAKAMLHVIKDSGGACGLKIAGGVRTTQDALDYLQMAADVLGTDFLDPSRFRFGASSLLGSLLATLGVKEDDSNAESSSY